MPHILLTYDVRRTTETIHTELKNHLIQHHGFTNRIAGNDGRTAFLPNTTLAKVETTADEVVDAFLTSCRAVNAHWEKYIAVEYRGALFDEQR